MGLTFESQEVETRVKEIFSFCEEYRIGIYDFYDLEDDYEDEEVIIDNYTSIRVDLPHSWEGSVETNIESLNQMIKHAKRGEIIDESIFVSPNIVLIHVECEQRDRLIMLKESEYLINQKWNGKEVQVRLINDLNCYNIRIIIDDNFDKHFPPITSEDLFIEIISSEVIDFESIDEITQSYIFECSSTLELDITAIPRKYGFDWEEEDAKPQRSHELRLRPLIHGKGITEVLKIYNECNSISNPEFRILTYTKVIEYVSQTVLRKEMVESITKKLYSPNTLNPDAKYILELEKLYEEHKNNRKDNQAIRLTVETCCDIIDLVSSAPNYLKKTKKLTFESSKESRSQCLEEFANSISDTRNMIAHAKTNYKLKNVRSMK
ncbi:hypothetical protein ACP26L_01400 [Paenibacillus sp. S-38]|uniref:hypothetical protein n=1 Tax=Paenibacillus sp. S-38 TaxID=3416710 RepID=UPI003CF84143